MLPQTKHPRDAKPQISVMPNMTCFERIQLTLLRQFVRKIVPNALTAIAATTFFVDGLPENYDRLFFQQRRAEVGVRWEPRKDFNFSLAVGYAFGQEFSTGFDFRQTDEFTDVSDEPYVRVGFDIRF